MTINLAECPFTVPGTSVSRTLGDRAADFVCVSDFGAVGDDTHDDGPAIQAALDAAFGPATLPNWRTYQRLNKTVVFPPGIFKTGQQLYINTLQGGAIIGAGQYATRIRYAGPDSQGGGNGSLGYTALLVAQSMTYTRIKGITFDVTDSNAAVAVTLQNWCQQTDTTPSVPVYNNGTANSWTDCGFVGSSLSGFVVYQGAYALGSEQLFTSCRWENCASYGGLRIVQANALNYLLKNCLFKNCTMGISCVEGSVNAIIGCDFIGNSVIDIHVKQRQCPAIIGCRSTSPNFAACGPCWIAGCYHTGSGYFWDNGGSYTTDDPTALIEGCQAPNSTIRGSGRLYLRGNQFDNLDLLSSYSGTVVENH